MLHPGHPSDRKKLLVLFLLAFFIVAVIIRIAFQEAASPADSTPIPEGEPAASVSEKTLAQPETVMSLSSEEKAQSKGVAIAFVRAYAAYDGRKPEVYITNSKPYMTKALYKKEAKNLRRETLDRNRTKVLATEIYPVEGATAEEIHWNVVTLLQGMSPSGHTVKEEVWYWVTVEKEKGTWKVGEVSVE